MLTLVGFAVSNYYNKVKIQLLEKGVPFQEELNWAAKDEPTLACSPLGKVPFLRTAQGPLCESAVIAEYVEDAYPQTPLLPADPYARAKVRELVAFMELHLEMVARRLYPQAYFGGNLEQSLIDPTRTEHIDSAEQQILTAEKEAADPQVTAHKVVQQAKRRLATLTHQPADSQPPESTPPVCTPAADPSVGQSNPAVKQPAPASPAPAPPERRLKIRFEGGYALHMHEKDESETKRYRTAAGYLYTAFLGRFAFRRLAVAFGPYFSWFRTDPKGYDSHADVIDAGAHVELDVYFSARSRRVVSLHPFLEIGVGRVRPHYTEDSPMTTRFVGNATSGATFAPGLSLCFLEGSICPTVRFKVLPDLAGFDFSPQFGLAFNLPPARPLRRPHPADHANLSQHPHRAPPARRLSDRPFGDRAPRPVQRTAGRL